MILVLLWMSELYMELCCNKFELLSDSNISRVSVNKETASLQELLKSDSSHLR